MDRSEFYADDSIWDHEFCADDDVCDNDCPYAVTDEDLSPVSFDRDAT